MSIGILLVSVPVGHLAPLERRPPDGVGRVHHGLRLDVVVQRVHAVALFPRRPRQMRRRAVRLPRLRESNQSSEGREHIRRPVVPTRP
eukprot:2966941-Pyramimonas_sp.AAC.1